MITGYKAARNRPLPRGQKLSNKALTAVGAPVEHGFAHFKNWRILGEVRTDPKWATVLVRALLVLTNAKSPDDRRSSPKSSVCHPARAWKAPHTLPLNKVRLA